MNEQDLRALVREAIAAHRGMHALVPSEVEGPRIVPVLAARQHISHAVFALPAGADTDGACLIEPAVPCNHCGYCKSMGH